VHNRWHPDIEPVLTVSAGEVFTVECQDGGGNQLSRASKHQDLLTIDGGLSHPLAGPIYVNGAEPGDLLEVSFLEFQPADFGWTGIFPAFGVLADLFQEPYLVKWEIDGGHARTSALPGVALPAAPFPGVVGVAPSHETLARWQARENAAAAHGAAVVFPSSPESAIPSYAAGGIRTVPARELGGNLDIRQLGVGGRLFIPVDVPGALLSIGDVHFVQGDGEVCGAALEIAAAVTLKVDVVKRPPRVPRFPAYAPAPQPTRPWFATTGMPINADGVLEYENFGLCMRNALVEMIEYLVSTYGFAREAAYALTSVAVDLRLSSVVGAPMVVVSAFVPLDIFESSE
jgi:formamidase